MMEYANEEERILATVLEEGKKMIDSTEDDLTEAENETESLEKILATAEGDDEEAQRALDAEIEAILGETDEAAVELAEYLDRNN